jgi:putative membrane protein
VPDSPAAADTLRDHLANERTLLAWVRTGIAIMAFGFAIAQFGLFLRQLVALSGTSLPLARSIGSTWLGAALVALGTVSNALATVRYGRVRRAIERGPTRGPGVGLVYALGFTTALVGVVMAVLLARTMAD